MNTVIAQAYVRIKGNIKKRYKALTEKGFVVIQVHPSRKMFRRTWETVKGQHYEKHWHVFIEDNNCFEYPGEVIVTQKDYEFLLSKTYHKRKVWLKEDIRWEYIFDKAVRTPRGEPCLVMHSVDSEWLTIRTLKTLDTVKGYQETVKVSMVSLEEIKP